MIFFSGSGGLSGDIWLATLLAALDHKNPGSAEAALNELEGNIPWMSAELELREEGTTTQARIRIQGETDSPSKNWSGMRDFVLGTNFTNEVKKGALRALYNRQYHEARGLGFPLEKMQYTGKEVGDTLFDILGGMFFWSLLGSPSVSLSGYLDVGYFPPPATRKLLADIPNKTPRQERELTTPTASTLLRETYKEIEEPDREPDLVVVSGGRYAEAGRVAKTISRHYW